MKRSLKENANLIAIAVKEVNKINNSWRKPSDNLIISVCKKHKVKEVIIRAVGGWKKPILTWTPQQ